MKKIITALLVVLGSASISYAQLATKPVAELLRAIEASKFTYREHALAYGYDSIHSCLYTSKDFAILKNYCYPNKPYPAQGFTVISAKFGIVNFYEENLGQGILKHDVRIDVFPENYKDYAGTATSTLRIKKLNSILADLYERRMAACWSTNFSRYTEQPELACNNQAGAVGGIDVWGKETQTLTADKKAWAGALARINSALKK
jgi:hypothetical protein